MDLQIDPVAAATNYLSNPAKTHATIKKFIRLVKDGRFQVFIFGAGGVGKTTLAKKLSNLAGDPKRSRYMQSIETEYFDADGDRPSRLTVATGQTRDLEVHAGRSNYRGWEDLAHQIRKVTERRPVCLLHICAFGYHTTKLAWDDVKVVEVSQSESKFSTYIRMRRAHELESMDYLATHITAANRPIHMLTIVNKQDLWWEDRHAVQRFYEHDAYNSSVGRLEARLGTNRFNHDYLYLSAVIENLYDGTDNRKLAENCRGYDEPMQARSYGELARALQSVLKSRTNLGG